MAHLALRSDADRPTHYFMLHMTDIDSQAAADRTEIGPRSARDRHARRHLICAPLRRGRGTASRTTGTMRT